MTVPSEAFRSDHIGDGTVSTYSFGFAAFHKSHLKVLVLNPSVPPYATLVVDVNYTVDLNAKTITLLGASYAPLPLNHLLAIILNPPLTQDSDVKNADSYHLDLAETDHDRRVQQIQRVHDVASRALALSPMEAGSATLTELPDLASRKGKALAFNATTGKPEASSLTSTPMEVQWTFAGTVSTDQNANLGRYRAKQSITFAKFDVNFTTAGTGGNTVINFLKNGVVVATVTVASGSREQTTTVSVSLVAGDELYPEVASVAPTTPPVTGVFSARS